MMGLTSHISFISDTFPSYHVYFSLMTSMKMMGMGPDHMVRDLLHFALSILLVLSVAVDLEFLVDS